MTRTKTLLVAVAAAASSVLLLAGCAGTPNSPATADGRIAVVASTNVYGQIAEEVGGDRVDVTSLISSTSQDPHEFEASAGDQLKVSRAGILIENGGGYDPFMESLAQASGTKAPLITAAELAAGWKGPDDLEGFNEHVFYDPATMAKLADRLADELGAIQPAHADEFTANAKRFSDGVAKLTASLDDLASAHAGEGVFVTEPLPLYLTEAAGLVNKTPDAFSEAVEEGQDVPPATLLTALGIIGGGDVSVVITNAQAAGAETTQVEQKAADAGIPVLRFSEILPDATTYLGWMQDNIAQLAAALGR